MQYRLDEVEKICRQHGLTAHHSGVDQIDVVIRNDMVLSFVNHLDGGDDTLIGFRDTPWHFHGVAEFMTGPDTSVEFDELELLIGLLCGELLIISHYRDNKLFDQWIVHKDDPLDLNDIQAGEEYHVCRLG